MRVLSLGAGVQSTTLALMAAHGEIEMPDCAIFADTGAEPRAVYDHLNWLETQLPFPLYRVSRGDLKADCLANVAGQQNGKRSTIPAFSVGKDGIGAPVLRQCTRDYKVEPIRQKIRELLGVDRGRPVRGVTVERWLGISTDEAHRMKMATEPWATNRWPLIERSISRAGCLQWLADHQYPRPPKSACIFCPYHSDVMWRDMKNGDPESWSVAVEFDQAIRSGFTGSRGEVFLHKSLRPLGDVDLRSWDERGQPDLFGNECEGMCGV